MRRWFYFEADIESGHEKWKMEWHRSLIVHAVTAMGQLARIQHCIAYPDFKFKTQQLERWRNSYGIPNRNIKSSSARFVHSFYREDRVARRIDMQVRSEQGGK